MATNDHFYGRNSQTPWPIDPSATTKTDDGQFLPSNILIDLHMRYDSGRGLFPFLSSLSVTDSLVTFTIEAADFMTGGSFQPLAAASIPQPAPIETMIALEALVPGVGGWFALGKGAQDWVGFRGRWSTPMQSLLMARCAKPYRPLPVTSLSKLYGALLQGVVDIAPQLPLSISKEQRTIGGVSTEALVFRLASKDPGGFAVASGDTTSLLNTFSGPCNARPESGNCPDPQPINFINSVGPDCNGQITLEFTGCAEISQLADRCGVVIDCNIPLQEVCTPPQIPDEQGNLPGTYTPETIIPPIVPPPIIPPQSEIPQPSAELPHIECFNDFFAHNFVVITGSWVFNADWSPSSPCAGISEDLSEPVSLRSSYTSNDVSTRNTAVWEGGDITTLFRKGRTSLKFLDGPSGSSHNGGLVFNQRPITGAPGRFAFWLASISYEDQTFGIYNWNGTTLVPIATVTLPGIGLDKWYDVTMVAVPDAHSALVQLTATMEAVDGSLGLTTIGPVGVSGYYPSTGWIGLSAAQGITEFSYLEVDFFPG